MRAAVKSRTLPPATTKTGHAGSTPVASDATTTSNGTNNKPTNAWSRPLQQQHQQQSQKPGPPPGMTATSNKQPSPPLVLRERFLHLTLSMVGQKVVVTRTNGTVLEGILHTFSPFSQQPTERRNLYVLKACQSIVSTGSTETTTSPTSKQDVVPTGSTCVLPADQVASVLVKSMRLDKTTASTNSNPTTPNPSSHGDIDDTVGFRTDTEISHFKHDAARRELLVADSSWTSAAGANPNRRAAGLLSSSSDKRKGQPTTSASASTSTRELEGSIGQWDQFKANEDLFQVRAGFDESIYTTPLDKSQMDRQQIKKAERLAKEIESTTSANLHIAEERGQTTLALDNYDEEDRYSGVLKVTTAKKTMNYAAAAKADPAGGKAEVAPPGFSGGKVVEGIKETTSSTSSSSKDGAEAVAPAPVKLEQKDERPPVSREESESKSADKEPAMSEPEEGKKVEKAETTQVEDTAKPTAKLNAKAKAFTFNPNVKSFTPGGGMAPPQQEPPVLDPNTGMPFGQPQYVQHPGMGQPGMMPMMNPPYVRYQGAPYPGMEHHMGMPPPQQPQQNPKPPPPPPPPPQDGTGSQSSGEAEHQTSDAPPQQAQQQPPQGMPAHYGPQGSYYPTMIPPRGPGGPPMYPQQQVQYRQMYGGPMAGPGGMPNMAQMRGTPPYYPGPQMGAMHYPSGGGYPGRGGGMMEEDYRGGGRGGRGGYGRGRRNSGYGRGRGRGGYPQNGGGNGRQTPQSGSEGGDGGSSKTPSPAVDQPSESNA